MDLKIDMEPGTQLCGACKISGGGAVDSTDRFAAAFKHAKPSGITSFPIPSPAITAILKGFFCPFVAAIVLTGSGGSYFFRGV